MPAIAFLVKESLSGLIKVVTTPRNIEFIRFTAYPNNSPWAIVTLTSLLDTQITSPPGHLYGFPLSRDLVVTMYTILPHMRMEWVSDLLSLRGVY